jgi:hypothetical protein
MWKPSKLPPPQVLRTYRLEFVLRGHVVCLNHESSIWITCGEYAARQVVGRVSRQALRKLPPYPVSGTDFAQGHSSCAHRRITSGEKDGDCDTAGPDLGVEIPLDGVVHRSRPPRRFQGMPWLCRGGIRIGTLKLLSHATGVLRNSLPR